MKKLVAILAVALAIPTMGFAEEQYPKEICKQMYDTVGVFLQIADKAWKSQDEEKALLYSTAAANYLNKIGWKDNEPCFYKIQFLTLK